jgi:UDP-glucose 4-epimerase
MNKRLKTIIVTGGLGSIGICLVNFFYNRDYNVIIIDNKKKSFFSKINFKKKNKFY